MLDEDRDAYRFPIEVTAGDLEKALRELVADLDYDLHKALEMNYEGDGTDSYPEIAVEFYYNLKKIADQY